MEMGPVQMLVVGFDEPNFTGEILAELRRLREADIVRLIDLMVVSKEDGELAVVQASDLSQDEAMEFGALVGALVGFGTGDEEKVEAMAGIGAEEMADGHVFDEDDVWYVADTIPEGGTAAIALLEHQWAIPLRNAIGRAGGRALADEWIHAKDLIAVGIASATDDDED